LQNSLVQTVLKLTSPGVPDIYQGSERLNLSLMDPDNRRHVDFSEQADADNCTKSDMITKLLHHRREHPRLFCEGDYEALTATGPGTDLTIAFSRSFESDRLLTICTRFPAARERSSPDGTMLPLPNNATLQWLDLITGQHIDATSDGLCVSAATRDLPVAVLIPQ
jgi:(1->4)-alpha-D-glucan 1-alpha-D-glucosylmutase